MGNSRGIKENQNPSVAKAPGTAVAHTPSEDAKKQRRRVIGIAFLLAITTAVVYSGVFRNDFISYDDDEYVLENAHVRQGFSWNNVSWAFTSFYASNWHPLTWLSHMLDVQLFGLNPAGHHFNNLFFHILATLLLFGFLRYATGKLWTSAFVAALFALHPVHVESVAWVAERKDVLSTVFWFATLWAYAYYARRPGAARYAVVAILFALGLMAKPMLVTLPLTLLLLDYWPLNRLVLDRRCFGRLVAEKLPLLIMTIASVIITVIAQQEAIASLNRFDLAARTSNAILSYCIYIGQSLCPTGLAMFHPYPLQPHLIEAMAGMLLLIAITATVFRAGKQRKYLTTGWLWYLITLIPVIGIIQVGIQAHADRYTYVPFIGIFIMISWGLKTFTDSLQNSKKLLVKIAAAVLFMAMIGITWVQVGYWKSDFTLLSHSIAVIKRNYLAYNYFGFLLVRTGRLDEAIANYRKALEINPNYVETHNNIGILLAQSGRTDEAIAHYRKALEINPNYVETHNNIGILLAQSGRTDEAITHYRKALEINPNYAEAHFNLGNLLANSGRTDEAITHFLKALDINPNLAKIHNNLGNLLANSGHTNEAIAHYRKALESNPNYTEAYNNLGNLLSETGRMDEAIACYKKALEINPNYTEAHYNFGNALLQIGRTDEAIACYQKILEIKPDDISTLNNLAHAFVQNGQLTDAIPLLQKAFALAKAAGDEAQARGIAGNLKMLNQASRSSPVNQNFQKQR
jgi:protein O-mannosyl-transferase